MKKYIIIVSTLFFITIFSINSFAIMNLLKNETSSNSNTSNNVLDDDIFNTFDDEDSDVEDEDNYLNTFDDEDPDVEDEENTENVQSPSVINSSKNKENFFTATNILNVGLLAVGIVIIFLGIAILVKIK